MIVYKKEGQIIAKYVNCDTARPPIDCVRIADVEEAPGDLKYSLFEGQTLFQPKNIESLEQKIDRLIQLALTKQSEKVV